MKTARERIQERADDLQCRLRQYEQQRELTPGEERVKAMSEQFKKSQQERWT